MTGPKTFRTSFDIPSLPRTIKHEDKMLLVGSCFVEHIGARLKQYKFNVALNPHGIVYNPRSISRAINRAVAKQRFTEDDLRFSQLWYSLDHHSKFSNRDKEKALNTINQEQQILIEFIGKADHIIITLGTAWVYHHKDANHIVSNCHKLGGQEFEKRKLSTKEIIHDIQAIIDVVHGLNPLAQFIFTVSPVRHLRDGFLENQLSKASLLLAVHHVTEHVEQAYYFPAYELLMDDLRDYRFYASDMVHPSPVAIDYIWDKFTRAAFETDTLELLNKLSKINTSLSHRSRFPGSEEHRKFVTKLVSELQDLSKEYICLDFAEEIKKLERSMDIKPI